MTVNHRGTELPDAEGLFGAATLSTTQGWGRVMLDETKEEEAAGRFAEDINIIVVLPIGTVITPKDQIVVNTNPRDNSVGSNINLLGTYEVMAVDYTGKQLECESRMRVID